jgi:hypothetical protein
MQERRRVGRTRVLKTARLICNEHAIIDCTVHDLTTRGAWLQVPDPQKLPETFDLSFDSFRSVRRCHVRWRADGKVGVSFAKAS